MIKSPMWVGWVGLLQAAGVVFYCSIISFFLQSIKKIFISPPEFLIAIFMLCLLVFSAAVTGSIVFGYPVYLAVNKNFGKGLMVLLYTLLSFLVLLILIMSSLTFWIK